MLDTVVLEKSKMTDGACYKDFYFLISPSRYEPIVDEHLDFRVSLMSNNTYQCLFSGDMQAGSEVTIKDLVDYWFGQFYYLESNRSYIPAFIGNFNQEPFIHDILLADKAVKMSKRMLVTSPREFAALISQRFTLKYRKCVYDYIMSKCLEKEMSRL